MKKLLLSIITILAIALVAVTAIKGIKIGQLSILGISQIKDEDETLEEKIKEATKLASTDFQKKMDDLNEEIKKLEKEKTSYEEMISVSTDSEVQAANQSYKYTIDMLYIIIENHAKTDGVNITMNLSRGSSGAEDVYNINFTAVGPYVGIEEFITDIEDNSKLGFKIEEFRMLPSSDNKNSVQATFTCKDITITGLSSNSLTAVTSTTNTTNTTTEDNTAK